MDLIAEEAFWLQMRKRAANYQSVQPVLLWLVGYVGAPYR